MSSNKKGLSLGTACVLAFLSLSAPTIITPKLPGTFVYAQTGAKVRSITCDFVPEGGCPVQPTALRCELDVDPFDAPMDARVYVDYRNNSDRAVSAVKFRLRFVDAQGTDRGTFHAVDMFPVSPLGSHGLKAKRDFTLHPAVVALKARVLQVKYSDGGEWTSVKMQELARPGGGPAPVSVSPPSEDAATEPAPAGAAASGTVSGSVPGQDPNSPNEAFDSGTERKRSKHSRTSASTPSRAGYGAGSRAGSSGASANVYPSGSSVGAPNPRVYENLPPGAAQSVQTIGPGAESASAPDPFNPAAAATHASAAPAAPSANSFGGAVSSPHYAGIGAATPPTATGAPPAAAGAATTVGASSTASTAPGATPAPPTDAAANPANSPYTTGRYKGVQPLNVPYSPENDK